MNSYVKSYTETDTSGLRENQQNLSELHISQSAGTSNPEDVPQKLENTQLDSDTSPHFIIKMIVEEKLVDDLQILNNIGKREIFEDGIDDKFSQLLKEILSKYGVLAVEKIGEYISQDKFTSSIVAEILKLLAEYNQSALYEKIYPVVIFGLKSVYVDVRDGAINSLASLDDPRSIPTLKKAIDREMNAELREDMEAVLEQLIDTREGK